MDPIHAHEISVIRIDDDTLAIAKDGAAVLPITNSAFIQLFLAAPDLMTSSMVKEMMTSLMARMQTMIMNGLDDL